MEQTLQIVLLFILIILNGVVVYAWRRGLKNMNKKKKSPFPDSNETGVSEGSSKKNKISDLIHLIWPFIATLLLMILGALLFL